MLPETKQSKKDVISYKFPFYYFLMICFDMTMYMFTVNDPALLQGD